MMGVNQTYFRYFFACGYFVFDSVELIYREEFALSGHFFKAIVDYVPSTYWFSNNNAHILQREDTIYGKEIWCYL